MGIFWTLAVFAGASYVGYESGSKFRDFLAYTKGQYDARRAMSEAQQAQAADATPKAKAPQAPFVIPPRFPLPPIAHIQPVKFPSRIILPPPR